MQLLKNELTKGLLDFKKGLNKLLFYRPLDMDA